MANSDGQASRWEVAAVVTFYMAVAIIMIMTNKWVLTTSSLPLTFLFLQLVIAVLLLYLLAMISTPPTSDPTPLPTSTKAAAAPKQTPFTFIIPRWSKSIIWAMAPVTATNIIGLAFNIYCLKLVDASYFQVARGLTLPMTVVLQSLTTGEKPTMGTIASCGLVTWGFTYSFIPSPFGQSASTPQTGIASTEAPMLGMALGVAAAAMVAIHAILIKQALKVLDGRTLDLAYWQNFVSALALLPAIAVSGELGGIMRMISGEEGSLSAFLIGSGLTGVVGFLICLAGFLSIKVTSPVTHMFSAAIRSVLQTLIGVWLFHDVLNASRVVSILLIMAGGMFYTYIKSRPTAPKVTMPVPEVREPLLNDGGLEKGSGYEEKANR